MNTNALPRTGGIPLRPQPLRSLRQRGAQQLGQAPVAAAIETLSQHHSDAMGASPHTQNHSQEQNQVHPGAAAESQGKQNQSTQNQAAADKPAEQQLREAIGHASDVLMTSKTVFPFTLFPDTITVDRSKFSVNKRFFFAVSEAFSIRIEDILNVTADTGPFFGSIRVSTRFYTDREPFEVNYLWRSDALRLKRILQGYVIAAKKGIDCSAMPAEKLSQMLDDLGKGAPGER